MDLSVRRGIIAMTALAVIVMSGCHGETRSNQDADSGDASERPAELLPTSVQELTIDGREYAFAITPDPRERFTPRLDSSEVQ
jgi:hypothetical protein